MKRAIGAAATLAFTVACESTPSPVEPTALQSGVTASVGANGVQASATGGGHYLLQSAFDVQFSFSAVDQGNGRAAGNFHQRTEDENGTIEFFGAVTCLSVDSVNRRAWVGGVITANNSTNPGFNTLPQHQVGHDIWFRVLDNGQGPDAPDRTTFVGFEGIIPSSKVYCRDRIWPEGNARTWPVTAGNLSVSP